MGLMGLEAISPKPRLTQRHPEHRVYPSLRRGGEVVRPNQVGSSDITYVPLRQGFLYLTVILAWYRRYVLSWRRSNPLDGGFCLDALEGALERQRPEIFNSDPGARYPALAFTGRLEAAGGAISMDGRGRALDNVLVERLWRTGKDEHLYAREDATPWEVEDGLSRYFAFDCRRRIHQSLGYRTPGDVYGAT